MLLEWKGKSYNLLIHLTLDFRLGLVAYKEPLRREKLECSSLAIQQQRNANS